MAAWRYKISLLMLKNISLVRCTHLEIFSTLEEKFCISVRPCNYLCHCPDIQLFTEVEVSGGEYLPYHFAAQ